ncbi:MAG: PDZ domain-containing protein [Clostridiaceae bacterium]
MNIALYTLRTISYALTNPYSMLFLFVLGIYLYRQNRKTSLMQKMVIGEQINSPFELTISQIVMGIFAGVLGSLLMSYLGVMFFQNSVIEILFLTSIFLMMINPRFICFSYSGAILGGISILNSLVIANGGKGIEVFKFDITSLMSMIAILHFVEGLLIILDGSRGAIPVFARMKDKIAGGFALKRYWPLPIAIFIILNSSTIAIAGKGVPMPEWWPIIKTTISKDLLKNAMISLMPFYAVLGYNSVTFSKSKEKKALTSGLYVMVYSIVLFALAQLSPINIIFQVFIVIFAPLAHEALIKLQRLSEENGKPKYVSEDGMKILYVSSYSPAASMNIKSGDSLMEINGEPIESEDDILNILKETTGDLFFKIKKESGKIKEILYGREYRKNMLGIVFVPKYIQKDRVVLKFDNEDFSDILNNIKNKDKDEDGDE